MAERWVCSECAVAFAQSGTCGQCKEESLLDSNDPDVRILLGDIERAAYNKLFNRYLVIFGGGGAVLGIAIAFLILPPKEAAASVAGLATGGAVMARVLAKSQFKPKLKSWSDYEDPPDPFKPPVTGPRT